MKRSRLLRSSCRRVFGLVEELVHRRRLMERYAPPWLACALVLFGLWVLREGLKIFADAVGIAYALSALLLVALGSILLLLPVSLVITRLADRTKVPAQRLGLVRNELDDVRAALAAQRDRNGDWEHVHS